MAKLYTGADLVDAYGIALPPGATTDIDRLARFVLGNPSGWVRGLLRLRDAMMAPFGVKTSRALQTMAGPDRINFFGVVERSEYEMIVGEDDRHLNFCTSILLRPAADGRELVMTTAVHCHNRLGRAYLALILPFHRVIVASMLRRAASRGWPAG